MNKKSSILKFAATAAIACSVSLVTNIDLINATSNNKSNIKNVREVKDGWKLENGKWYYYKSGNKKTGWLKEDNKWYYLKSDGVMTADEWQCIDGKWYMFQESGVMYANSWYKDNRGNWYWLKGSGAMASNEILRVDDKYYKFYESGSYKTIPDNNIAKIKECDFLNIRSESNSTSRIIGKVYTGEFVEVLSEGSIWTKIQTTRGIIGWVSSKYIEVQYNNDNIDARVQKVIDVAKKQLGKPYFWG